MKENLSKENLCITIIKYSDVPNFYFQSDTNLTAKNSRNQAQLV